MQELIKHSVLLSYSFHLMYIYVVIPPTLLQNRELHLPSPASPSDAFSFSPAPRCT